MILTRFLTINEAAQTLQVTRQAISKYIAKKELNAIKINKSYRIQTTDLEAFLNSKMVTGGHKAIQLSKSRQCSLEYEGKYNGWDEGLPGRQLSEISKTHSGIYNRFIFGDNLEVLKLLLPDMAGKVDLIYIDPPFGTGKDFADIDNDHAYSDKLINSDFLEFIRKRLVLLHKLLSEKGSIYLHIDKKIGHYVKVLMDEIFGYENFIGCGG